MINNNIYPGWRQVYNTPSANANYYDMEPDWLKRVKASKWMDLYRAIGGEDNTEPERQIVSFHSDEDSAIFKDIPALPSIFGSYNIIQEKIGEIQMDLIRKVLTNLLKRLPVSADMEMVEILLIDKRPNKYCLKFDGMHLGIIETEIGQTVTFSFIPTGLFY